jgi:hypothetical protein
LAIIAVVGGDLQGPDLRALVVGDRAQHEAPLGGGVLGAVELGQHRHQRMGGPGEVLVREAVVDLELDAVLEVERVLVELIQHHLHRARARDGGVQRLR